LRVLVVYAHPVETSFNAELHRTVVTALARAGHDVDDLDLYAEDFDPRLSREERLGYHDLANNRAPVAGYVERLLAAEAIVFVHPVWNFGLPAILKGFLDRVFLPGVSFVMRDGRAEPAPMKIGKVAVVTTYGGARWRAALIGDPPRKVAKRFYRTVFRTRGPVAYHALYDMNRATDADRGRFLAEVETAMERF